MNINNKIRIQNVRSHESTSRCESQNYDYTQQVGHLLRRAYQRHLAIFQTYTADNQLTSVQFSILCALHTHGPSSQADLVRTSAIDQATIRGILERLKQRHLVDFASDENDRRKVIYDLTADGQETMLLMIPKGFQISEETVRDLNPAEQVAFLYLLRKLVL
jgi:DNA-binding MarR family transcriptional regulator